MKVDVTTPEDDLQKDASACTADECACEPDAIEIDAEVIEEDPAEDAAQDEAEPACDECEAEAEDAAEDEDDGIYTLGEIEAAKEEAAAANERYLRLQAEWENFRKRTARERDQERERATSKLVEKLIPVMDDIERALEHAPKDAMEADGAFAQFVGGIEAIKAKLSDVFDREGVEVIDPAGQAFNLNEHQAVAMIPDPSVPNETVKDVYQKGYRMGGRVLRNAMVTVSTGGPARVAEEAADAEA